MNVHVETATGQPAKMTRDLFAAGRPRSADIHLFESEGSQHLFVVNGSRLFDVEPQLFAQLGAAIAGNQVGDLLSRIGVAEPPLIDEVPLSPPPVHALSLAVAQ